MLELAHAYNWLRCPDTTIADCAVASQSSASASTTISSTLQQADVGDKMLLDVTASNSAGQTSAYTASFSFSGTIEAGSSPPPATAPSNTSAPTGYGSTADVRHRSVGGDPTLPLGQGERNSPRRLPVARSARVKQARGATAPVADPGRTRDRHARLQQSPQ